MSVTTVAWIMPWIKVAFRKIPTYIARGRAGFVLQRGVPKGIRHLIGKSIFKEPAGKTLQEARARVQSFLERTDREIAIARREISLSTEEQIERLTFEPDPDAQELYILGAEVDEELTQGQRERVTAIVTGKARAKAFYGMEDLLGTAVKLKSPAARTAESWRSELKSFMEFCGKSSLLACKVEDAVRWRGYLLQRVSANTVKTRIAYLSGLWSILVEEHPGHDHIFKGLTKRIKIDKEQKTQLVSDPLSWSGSIYVPIFKIYYYTGCRLAEIAGLLGEDLLEDRILIRPNSERPLKTKASEREIPIHPKLQEIVSELRGKTGYLWPSLQSGQSRWGHNLSTPCKKITGVNPHALRHRVATKLRECDFNEAVIGRLLGHTPNTITGSYGTVPWQKLIKAVECL